MGISYLLPRLVGAPLALEYLLTGRLFDGNTGRRIGFANHAVAGDEVVATARGIADQIAVASPTAVALTKRAVTRRLATDTIAHARREAVEQALMAQRPDFAEGVAALLEKREPDFGDIERPLPEA